MFYIIGAIITLIAGIIWWKKSKSFDDSLPSLLVVTSGFSIFVALIALPVNRVSAISKLQERDAIQQTYNSLRNSGRPLEMATTANKIAEWNAWLSVAQYWNDSQWDIYWPDSVETTKPIH